MKLFGFIRVGFDITAQLLIWRKTGVHEKVHQLYVDFKKAYDSFRRGVLYNILIEFGVPMKLVTLIKMCLNKMYSKVRKSPHLTDNVTIQKQSKITRYFIVTAFKLCFRVCH
jgi:hypothetical protein